MTRFALDSSTSTLTAIASPGATGLRLAVSGGNLSAWTDGTPTLRGSIPRAGRFELIRAGLLERVSALSEAAMIALVAPSGYGKTTLLAQYARSTPRQQVWVNADVHTNASSLGQTLLARTRAAASGRDAGRSPASLALELCEHLADLETNLELIIDGLETGAGDVQTFLTGLVTHLPEGHRLIVGARRLDGLPVAAWLAGGRLEVIGPETLSFSLEETSAYLKQRGSRSDALQLQSTLEGWPVGIAIAAAGQPGFQPDDLIRSGLLAVSAEVAMQLCALAVLPVWSEEAAQTLGVDLPEGWLEPVLNSGLPLVPLGRGQYRPHQLLRDHLLEQLRRQPQWERQLHLIALERAQHEGQLELAFDHALEADAPETAVRLAELLARQAAERLEHHRVLKLIERLPETLLSPELETRQARARLETGALPLARRQLIEMERVGRATALGFATLALIAGRSGQAEDQLAYGQRGLDAAQDIESRQLSWRQVALGLIALGRFEDSLEQAERFLVWAEEHGHAPSVASALTTLQYALSGLERLQEQRLVLSRALQLYDQLGWSTQSFPLLVELAELEAMAGHLDTATTMIERARRLAGMEANPGEVYALFVQGEIQLWFGQTDAALESLHLALEKTAAGMWTALRSSLHCLRAEAFVARNDRLGAMAELEQARRHRAHMDVWREPERLAFVEACLAWQAGDRGAARQSLEQVAANPPTIAYRARVTCLLTELGADISRAVLSGVLSTLGSEQVLNADRHLYSSDVRLIEAASPGTVRLEVTTLGRFELRVRNADVRVPLTRAREALVFLMLHGPCTRDELVDALWDGQASDQIFDYFRVAMRRLRRTLEQAAPEVADPIPLEGRRYRLSERFEPHLDALDLDLVPADADNNTLEAALTRYQGEFLPDSDGEWVDRQRETSRNHALRIALSLARRLEATDPDQAMRHYQRASLFDAFHVEAQLGSLRALVALGEYDSARRQVRLWRERWQREFGENLEVSAREAIGQLGLGEEAS